MSNDPITDFFRDAEVRLVKRQHDSSDIVHLVKGFGADGGRNTSVAVSTEHPLYQALSTLSEHLAACGHK